MDTHNLPTHAGGVRLQFSENERMPRRINTPGQPSSLLLPLRRNMEFHPFKGGEQFLVIYPGTRTRFGVDGRAFFGGMDESPFITSLEAPPVEALRKHGEEGFFEALVPEAVKVFREKFPQASVRRQGDVWSIRLPMTWNDLSQTLTGPRLVPVSGQRKLRKKQHEENKVRMLDYQKRLRQLNDRSRRVNRILGTQNHQIRGRCIIADFFVIEGVTMEKFRAIVAEGTLTAPDHAPHELLGGPSILVRTPHITSVASLRFRGRD